MEIICRTKRTAATRLAAARSPRRRRRFRHASATPQRAKTRSATAVARLYARPAFPANGKAPVLSGASSHGAMMRKKSGVPRHIAASTRIGVPSSGCAPFHATRVSAYAGGRTRGCVGVKRAKSSPAAAKSACQSGARAGHELCGIALNDRSRPLGSTAMLVAPGVTCGGSASVGASSGPSRIIGAASLRTQNEIGAGPFFKRSQRRGESSLLAIHARCC